MYLKGMVSQYEKLIRSKVAKDTHLQAIATQI